MRIAQIILKGLETLQQQQPGSFSVPDTATTQTPPANVVSLYVFQNIFIFVTRSFHSRAFRLVCVCNRSAETRKEFNALYDSLVLRNGQPRDQNSIIDGLLFLLFWLQGKVDENKTCQEMAMVHRLLGTEFLRVGRPDLAEYHVQQAR